MTKTEYLFLCLAEEGGELTQAAGKAGRFGATDRPPGGGLRNDDHVVHEINDVLAVVELLEEQGVDLAGVGDRQAIEQKKAKVLRFMHFSERRGVLPAPARVALRPDHEY